MDASTGCAEKDILDRLLGFISVAMSGTVAEFTLVVDKSHGDRSCRGSIRGDALKYW